MKFRVFIDALSNLNVEKCRKVHKSGFISNSRQNRVFLSILSLWLAAFWLFCQFRVFNKMAKSGVFHVFHDKRIKPKIRSAADFFVKTVISSKRCFYPVYIAVFSRKCQF